MSTVASVHVPSETSWSIVERLSIANIQTTSFVYKRHKVSYHCKQAAIFRSHSFPSQQPHPRVQDLSMYTSITTIWLMTTLLFATSFCHAKPSPPTPPSPPAYFLLHEFGREFNSGHFSGFDEAFIFAVDPATDAKDMSTNNAQSCSLCWNSTVSNSLQGQAPSEWQKDDAKSTWSCRMDSYISNTEFRMGIRHQYRLNNLPCLKPNGPDCVTRLAYIDFNTSAPGFRYYDSKNSRSEHASGQIQAFTGVMNATVYQHCKACGGLGGGKQERYFP